MKKQTAVEWLEKRAEEREKNNPNESAFWHLKELQKDFNQAKEIEKQQIMQAYNDGKASVLNPELNMSLEGYYKTKYN